MTAAETRDQHDVATINLVGGALCLDLANTVEGRDGPDRREALHGPMDLVVWSRRAGILSDQEADQLARQVEADPSVAGQAMARVVELREALYRVFTTIVRQRSPAESDLDIVQRTLAEGLRHARLEPAVGDAIGRFEWRWVDGGEPSIDLIRWLAAASAVDLLRFGRLDRLRQCPGGGEEPCNWLFLDTTRGGNRRWCSMSDCGSRFKWRRQNAKRRAPRR